MAYFFLNNKMYKNTVVTTLNINMCVNSCIMLIIKSTEQ